MNSLPKTVTRQRRDCNLNPGPSAPESSTLATRLPSHQGRYTERLVTISCTVAIAAELMLAAASRCTMLSAAAADCDECGIIDPHRGASVPGPNPSSDLTVNLTIAEP